ncbi:hypothetical protein AKJ36_03170 [candidate division MSBL1 archaeon SCGC-AAA259I07]|uniref:Uncharacterized protein n=1 Tax=candidate division MSBL1 archaeon SCGC-AAA259I07 TaxID=1698266 RepID=A0A133UJA0_9EURY|nr:hypothetical protein AKJ36_03170 [candidate division MSBL1 archaeon SCGC-AAA259I07]
MNLSTVVGASSGGCAEKVLLRWWILSLHTWSFHLLLSPGFETVNDSLRTPRHKIRYLFPDRYFTKLVPESPPVLAV